MITSLLIYILNIPIYGIFDKDIELCKKIKLSNLTHMMSMADTIAISVETPKIDNGCSLQKDFNVLIYMNL